jgi:hypothetical protein
MSNKIRTICVSRQPWSTLRDYLDAVAKVVGVSDDFERLAACEPVARRSRTGYRSLCPVSATLPLGAWS